MKIQRRKFIKNLSGTVLLSAASPYAILGNTNKNVLKINEQKGYAAMDNIQVGAIGMGIMGFNNVDSALKIPGVKLVAACDLYEGRLKRTKERYGDEVFTTKNFRELLDRDDIDAVIISTTDHWHDKITIAAMEKGKAVYCEKPMVHHLDEGMAVIDSYKKNNTILQIGSQHVSSIIYQKAKELYQKGEIGELVLAEARYDRNSASGAWQYPIPLDASEKTVDWDNFIGDAPKRKFDATRFFRWRNYQDYGTGVTGDLFVHLFTGMHLILNSQGPNKVYATGGIRYWKDGRDVPDVMLGSYDYPKTDSHPAFNMQMRVNFADGSGGGQSIRLIGTEGAMTIGNSVKVQRIPIEKTPTYGGWDSFNTFDKVNRMRYEKWHKEKYPKAVTQVKGSEIEFAAPEGYNSHIDHHANFFNAIRTNKKVVEDASFGFRAAAPALACNKSYFEEKIIKWDPINMKLV